jgi:hypothetical protein
MAGFAILAATALVSCTGGDDDGDDVDVPDAACPGCGADAPPVCTAHAEERCDGGD